MPGRAGVTLMELMVVLIIVGLAAAFFFPNYNQSVQTANSRAVKQNLLAIYSAQLNYFNGNGQAYCLSTAPICGDNLFDLNSHLNLNISCSNPDPCAAGSTDTGGYSYSCVSASSGFSCTAVNPNASTWQINNNSPIVLTDNSNPNCTGPYCPP